MAANDYFFFTDTNINVQTSAEAYGPITPGTSDKTDEYRITSLHTATFNPTAYAACYGIVCVQRVPLTTPPLVNIILKPLVQPALNFAPVKYFIYKGILADSLINGAETAQKTTNDLTKTIWKTQAKKNASATPPTNATPPADALGVGLTAATPAIPNDPIKDPFNDGQPIDNLFYRTGVSFQLSVVKGGWSIGLFHKGGFGMEVLMEGLNFHHPLSLARQRENKVSVATLVGSENPAQVFDHWHAKEQVLGYMDPCAFYGSFFLVGIQAKTSSDTKFALKAGNALYYDVLFAFANRNKAYLDIRNEHNFSFNYFGNYGGTTTVHGPIKLSYDPAITTDPAPIDYYASKWPILTLTASNFPNTDKARNAFRIQLPVGDNPQPLLYVSQGYRDINRRRNGFPAELKSAERFYDAFKMPVDGYTATKNASRRKSMTFVVPNVADKGATTPVSCYIRLKYLKQQVQQQGAATVPTVIQSANYLDNLIYPLDLPILFKGGTATKIRTAVYDEEIYVDAQNVPGLNFDFIGKVGIARDHDLDKNTTFYLIPTNIRTQAGQASTLVALSGETSEAPGSYANLIASKYDQAWVKKSDLMLSATENAPVAEFVSDSGDAAQASLTFPNFEKLFVIVVANKTYDSWQDKITGTLDGRFRVYLGVKDLQTGKDIGGIEYTSFELVLRGFVLDASTNAYKVEKANTHPANTVDNVKVYARLGSNAQASSSTQNVRIGPKQAKYVVVLDKIGLPLIAYPILEFDIKGPPNYIVDVQVSRDAPALLTGGPGLANAWDKNQPPEVRMTQIAFSSWTNGDQGIVLDASGKATYRMPLNWWKDLARLPLKDFGTANIRYRAVAWPSTSASPTAWSTKDGATAPKLLVRSNLVKFDLIDAGTTQAIDSSGNTGVNYWGYYDDKRRMDVLMRFTVREASTTEMYTIVQWKTGSSQNWPRPNPQGDYAITTDGGHKHWNNDLVPTIDSVDDDPRFPRWNPQPGTQWYPPPDNRTAIHLDSLGGPIDANVAVMQNFYAKDFDTKVYLNFEVPYSATVVKQGPTTTVGSDSVWNMVRVTIGPPEPFIIDHATWKVRILQVRRADGTIDLSHPDTYAGPQ